MQSVIPANPLQLLLGEAFTAILNQIQAFGDSLIPAGVFSFFGPAVDGHTGCALHVWNADNPQITWGILGAALRTLWDYMYVKGKYGSVNYEIYDGANEIAHRVIGVAAAAARSQ